MRGDNYEGDFLPPFSGRLLIRAAPGGGIRTLIEH
jgi:hypothetical protein